MLTTYFNKVSEALNRNEMITFWGVCVVLAVLQYFFGLQHFYFDAERYWECGRELKVEGVFSLSNHVTPRGVLFPLFNYALIELLGYLNWHEITVFKCLNTLFITWGFWYVLPAVYQKIVGKSFRVVQKIALVFIGNLFWFRYFSCPLSDFLCLFLVLYGFVLLWSKQPTFWPIIIVGCICGFVLNTRPIYSLLIVVYPLFLWLVSTQIYWRKILFAMAMVTVALLINLPQRSVNQKVWKSDSFFQPTDKYYNGKSLYLVQLKWGLYIQKYDTYVGDSACYKTPQVFYFHNRQNSITEAKQLIHPIESYEQYFRYVLGHPMSIVWYAKNFFNGLDIQYNSVYVFQLKPNVWFSLGNYVLWFMGIVLLGLTRNQWFTSRAGNFMGIFLLATTALSIPTAIEVRFMLPLFLMMYVLVVSHITDLFAWFGQLNLVQKTAMSLALIVFVFICFCLSNATYQQLEFGVNC